MSKSFGARKNILFLLIIIWNAILILFYWKPYLTETIQFLNYDEIKYEIIGGYVNKQFLEEYIYYNFILFVTSIICIISEFLFSFFSFKNTKWIKFIGIGIFTQTLISTLLNVWKNYFVDSYNGTEVISLKMWAISSIAICIPFIITALLKRKILYTILSIATIFQIISTITIFQSNRGFLLTESITNPYYFSLIFECVSGIIIYILYWMLILTKSK